MPRKKSENSTASIPHGVVEGGASDIGGALPPNTIVAQKDELLYIQIAETGSIWELAINDAYRPHLRLKKGQN